MSVRAVVLAGLCAVALAAAAGDPPIARLGTDAAVRLDSDDARLQFVLFTKFGSRQYLETLNETGTKVETSCSLNYRFVRSASSVVGAGRATLRAENGGVRFAHDLTAHATLKSEEPGFVLRLRAAAFAGAKWKTDAAEGVIPREPQHTSLGTGKTKSLAVDFPRGRKWTVKFPEGFDYEIYDTRRQDQDEIEFHFTSGKKLDLTVGKGAAASCLLTASDGKIQCATRDFHGVWQGKSWVKLDVAEGVRPSSALDFSRAATRKTPAGVDGRLFATTNGEFRFARAPNMSQRLFGCLVGGANLFADKPVTTAYTKRLASFGYNAIRLPRIETRLLANDPKKGLLCDPTLSQQLDQLVAVAARDGLYSFYDILSRPTWAWGDLQRPPIPNRRDPSPDLCTALCYLDDPAFGQWKAVAETLYGRKNKSARKGYPEDAAVPLVLTTVDRSAFGAWSELQKMPFMAEKYAAWLADRRQKDCDFMAGSVCEKADFGVLSISDKKAASVRRFFAEQEIAGLKRMKETLVGLKSKALVGAVLGQMHYGDVAPLRATAGDFTSCQFALDPPRHLGLKSTPPYRLANVNPLNAKSPVSVVVGWHERPDRAFCVTSWSSSAPSAWMASSGLLVGAWAAKHGWDAVLRDRDPLQDPFVAATERAVFALFARGDYNPAFPDCTLTLGKGALAVVTPRTAGGFSPARDGVIAAGPLTARLRDAKAAVWVTSLTDLSVSASKRLLLTHLTEMKKEGTLFADSRCDLLMVEGRGSFLVRDGSADVELVVDKASSFKVFALGTDGMRQARVPTETKDGVLTFTAAVRGAKNAQYLYELVRE